MAKCLGYLDPFMPHKEDLREPKGQDSIRKYVFSWGSLLDKEVNAHLPPGLWKEASRGNWCGGRAEQGPMSSWGTAAFCHIVLFPVVIVVSKQNGDVEVYNMPLENTSQKPGVKQQSLKQTVRRDVPANRQWSQERASETSGMPSATYSGTEAPQNLQCSCKVSFLLDHLLEPGLALAFRSQC